MLAIFWIFTFNTYYLHLFAFFWNLSPSTPCHKSGPWNSSKTSGESMQSHSAGKIQAHLGGMWVERRAEESSGRGVRRTLGCVTFWNFQVKSVGFYACLLQKNNTCSQKPRDRSVYVITVPKGYKTYRTVRRTTHCGITIVNAKKNSGPDPIYVRDTPYIAVPWNTSINGFTVPLPFTLILLIGVLSCLY